MTQITVADLAAEHRHVFSRAILAVLDTEEAIFTYAQILDGLPTAATFIDSRAGLDRDHPLRQHTQLCPGALEKAQEYRRSFNPNVLSFEVKLAQAFQDAELGTSEFNMRLIEMVAVALHRIAVVLYQSDDVGHKDDSVAITTWQRPISDEELDRRGLVRLKSPETLFSHWSYVRKDAYPNGVADIVGYWAENRILGGVVLFGRGVSGFGVRNSDSFAQLYGRLTGVQCDGVYLHSNREGVTYRIYKLLDSQVDALLDFLLGSSNTNPLPIRGDEKNRDRIDPVDAIEVFRVFRDEWEREPTPRHSKMWTFWKRRPKNSFDYPELDDQRRAMEAFWREREVRREEERRQENS
ncbi:hypothetical protein OQA88_5790 [Cercophora sp. LCS_1]